MILVKLSQFVFKSYQIYNKFTKICVCMYVNVKIIK
jgi:hypothetical protein